MAELATRAQDEELQFKGHVEGLRDGVGGLNATLGVLDKRVGDVAR